MASGDEWPVCASCHQPMRFVLQLDLARSPGDLGEGLVQLFYCPLDMGCETWAAFGGASHTRWVPGPTAPSALPPGVRPLTQRTIAGWEERWDLPDPEEHELLGLTYHYDFGASTVRIVCPELGLDEAGLDIDAFTAEQIGQAADLDKLLGWPRFVQGRSYPDCPRCGRELDFLFQVDSEVGTDLMFGDVGIGHIMRCAEHPEVLSFAWDCH